MLNISTRWSVAKEFSPLQNFGHVIVRYYFDTTLRGDKFRIFTLWIMVQDGGFVNTCFAISIVKFINGQNAVTLAVITKVTCVSKLLLQPLKVRVQGEAILQISCLTNPTEFDA